MKTTTIVFANEKGGVGKTTSTQLVGDQLVRQGKSVLFIDLDPQGNLSYVLDVETKYPDSLAGLDTPESAIKQIVKTKKGDIIPYTPALSFASYKLVNQGREFRLKENIKAINKEFKYDFILIDTPPELGIITLNAFTASDYVIIPSETDAFVLPSLLKTHETIETTKRYSNKDIKILGVLVTSFDERTNIAKNLLQKLKEYTSSLGMPILDTKIRQNVVLKESQLFKESLYEFTRNSNAGADYIELTKEILKKIEG